METRACRHRVVSFLQSPLSTRTCLPQPCVEHERWLPWKTSQHIVIIYTSTYLATRAPTSPMCLVLFPRSAYCTSSRKYLCTADRCKKSEDLLGILVSVPPHTSCIFTSQGGDAERWHGGAWQKNKISPRYNGGQRLNLFSLFRANMFTFCSVIPPPERLEQPRLAATACPVSRT